MVLSSRETQNKEFWRERLRKAIAPEFAIAAGGFDWPFINDIHKKIIYRYIDTQMDNVLDVACGLGRVAEWFANYTGFDFIEEFVEIAKRQHPTKKFVVADLTEPLPFSDLQFDWAILISVKAVVAPIIGEERWAKVVQELKRVAKDVLVLEYGNNDRLAIYDAVEVL